jgi:hypothetical protein
MAATKSASKKVAAPVAAQPVQETQTAKTSRTMSLVDFCILLLAILFNPKQERAEEKTFLASLLGAGFGKKFFTDYVLPLSKARLIELRYMNEDGTPTSAGFAHCMASRSDAVDFERLVNNLSAGGILKLQVKLSERTDAFWRDADGNGLRINYYGKNGKVSDFYMEMKSALNKSWDVLEPEPETDLVTEELGPDLLQVAAEA